MKNKRPRRGPVVVVGRLGPVGQIRGANLREKFRRDGTRDAQHGPSRVLKLGLHHPLLHLRIRRERQRVEAVIARERSVEVRRRRLPGVPHRSVRVRGHDHGLTRRRRLRRRTSLLKPTHHRTIPRTTDAGRPTRRRWIESTLAGRSIDHRVGRAPTSHRVAALRQSRVRAHAFPRHHARHSRTFTPSPHARHPSSASHRIIPRSKIRSRAIRSIARMHGFERTDDASSSSRVGRETHPAVEEMRAKERAIVVRSFVRSFGRSRVDMTTDRTVMGRPGR